MNKARITYRFDGDKDKRNDGENDAGNGREPNRVIPLFQEEYQVVEEQKGPEDGGAAGGQEDYWRQNGSGRPSQQREIRDYQGLNQYTTDFGAWSSPFDAETQRIEDMIRESNEREGRRPMGDPISGRPDGYRYRRPEGRSDADDSRVYREQQLRETANLPTDEEWLREDGAPGFDGDRQPEGPYVRRRTIRWDQETEDRNDPDGPAWGGPGWDGPEVSGPRYVRHNRTPWLKITAAIAGAAVTGVMLGFLALSLFNGPDDTSGGGTAQTVQNPAGQAQNALPVNGNVQNAAGGTAAGAGAAASSGKEIAMAYAGKTYSLLQNGTFSAQQGADQAKSDLLKKGLAAASEQTDKYYVFAGMAADKESAVTLGNQLKEKSKLDIYVKAYAVPAVSKVRWNGNGDTLKSYLQQSDKLVESINRLTVMNLEAGSIPGAPDASTMQSIATAHTAWSQLSATVAQEGGEENKAVLQRMNNALNSAKTSLDEYKKNPSTAMLWQAQTYTMQFVIAEKELLTKIGQS
jgi:stage II sporulation protein B